MSKSNKPEVMKAAVVAKAVMGNSKSQISRDLGIDRNTVRKILTEAEFSSLVGQGKSALYEMIPEAVSSYGTKVKANPDEAKDFLERVTVLPGKAEQGSGINLAVGLNLQGMPSIAASQPTETHQSNGSPESSV